MAVHHFCTEDAARYGVEEAILLWNIGFWCGRNLANRKNIKNGRVWTYNTRDAFIEQFPYIARGKDTKAKRVKVGRILQSLETQGAIVSEQLNKTNYDRTKWYSLADMSTLGKYSEFSLEALETLKEQICSFEDTDMFHQENDSVLSLTDNKQQIINRVSQSTLRAREKSSADESGNFSERVMAELLADRLPEHKHRYARLKIAEYQERFPESGSVADCYSYVVQAVTHQINLTGS